MRRSATVTGMATLAVLVHYDRDGMVADHVQYQVQSLRAAADRLVFVTAGALGPQARARLRDADDVIERDNTGYDFYSWRTGLMSVPSWADFDAVILANDSVVGPLVSVAELLRHRTATGADVYGITMSPQGGRHVQSYFMVFGRAALHSAQVRAFWDGMEPVDDRTQVIQRYELGLGRSVADAGLRTAAYFTPTPHEERLMAARMASVHRRPSTRPIAAAAAYALQPVRKAAESPVLGLWDRVFDDARLPVVKVSLFSRNPYRIDRSAVLARLEDRFPDAFGGFGAYLDRMGITW